MRNRVEKNRDQITQREEQMQKDTGVQNKSANWVFTSPYLQYLW